MRDNNNTTTNTMNDPDMIVGYVLAGDFPMTSKNGFHIKAMLAIVHMIPAAEVFLNLYIKYVEGKKTRNLKITKYDFKASKRLMPYADFALAA